jgi:hypothetical protein
VPSLQAQLGFATLRVWIRVNIVILQTLVGGTAAHIHSGTVWTRRYVGVVLPNSGHHTDYYCTHACLQSAGCRDITQSATRRLMMMIAVYCPKDIVNRRLVLPRVCHNLIVRPCNAGNRYASVPPKFRSSSSPVAHHRRLQGSFMCGHLRNLYKPRLKIEIRDYPCT